MLQNNERETLYIMKKQTNVYEEPVIEIVVFDENDFLFLSGNEVTPGEDGGIGLPDFGL